MVGEWRVADEKVDVMEGKEDEEVDERASDEEGEGGGKTIGKEFGGLESHREELPTNCSSVRMLDEGSSKLSKGAKGEP